MKPDEARDQSPLCVSCRTLAATLVVKATGRWVCGLCAPKDGRQVRLLMVDEATDHASSQA